MLDECRSLFRMQEARLGVTEMAVRLGRHRSTIYRELGRNRFRDPVTSRDIRAVVLYGAPQPVLNTATQTPTGARQVWPSVSKQPLAV